MRLALMSSAGTAPPLAFMVEDHSSGTSWKNGTFLIGLRSSHERGLHNLPSL